MSSTAPFRGEVYLHWNTANNKGYVGQTTQGMAKRWREHVRHSRSPKCVDYRYPFSRAIAKYGEGVFEHQVLALAKTKAELDNLEKVWIILLQTRGSGYNLAAGGEGNLGLRHGVSALAKMSKAKQGNRHCVGRPVSAETRVKLGSGNRGRVLSLEWRTKIAMSDQGRHHTDESKAKIAAANQGRVFSAETRAKMSAASRARSDRKQKA